MQTVSLVDHFEFKVNQDAHLRISFYFISQMYSKETYNDSSILPFYITCYMLKKILNFIVNFTILLFHSKIVVEKWLFFRIIWEKVTELTASWVVVGRGKEAIMVQDSHGKTNVLIKTTWCPHVSVKTLMEEKTKTVTQRWRTQ